MIFPILLLVHLVASSLVTEDASTEQDESTGYFEEAFIDEVQLNPLKPIEEPSQGLVSDLTEGELNESFPASADEDFAHLEKIFGDICKKVIAPASFIILAIIIRSVM
jgi:hypothetical protein